MVVIDISPDQITESIFKNSDYTLISMGSLCLVYSCLIKYTLIKYSPRRNNKLHIRLSWVTVCKTAQILDARVSLPGFDAEFAPQLVLCSSEVN